MSPGAFAFPGGRVEASDAHPDAERLCRGLTAAEAAARLSDVTPPERAIGFWIAALREAFEEVGLLLAYERDGGSVVLDAPRRLADRERCRAAGGGFGAMLLAQGRMLATDRMAYWAHWITPEERPIRYDTRFFVAAAFPQGTPEPDGVEVVACRWLTPEAALAHHAAGELALPMVTQEVLSSIAPHPTVAALLAAAPSRAIRPIRARIVVVEGRERILLPEDPGWY
jgi:8-oxo-dGTP pyrophosphatase MutT (NUDIX family)